jgi:hypothetical protein
MRAGARYGSKYGALSMRVPLTKPGSHARDSYGYGARRRGSHLRRVDLVPNMTELAIGVVRHLPPLRKDS